MPPWLRLALPALLCAWPLSPVLHAQAPQRVSPEQITIDAHAATTPFSHFWEQIFGSGNVTEMSFWTFDDVFEEGGPIDKPFVGAFGLIAKGGINKPSYYQFGLLHELGDRRIANDAKNLIVTKASDGMLLIAAWNLVDPGDHGSPQTLDLALQGVPANASVSIQRVDDDHGNVLPKYAALGNPVDPTPAQVIQLNQETALGPPAQTQLHDGKLTLELSPNALLLIKVQP